MSELACRSLSLWFAMCGLVFLLTTMPADSAVRSKERAVTIDEHHRLLVDGEPLFPICLSPGPPLRAKAPDGRDALEELREGGVNMLRLGLFVPETMWNKQTENELEKHLDWAYEHGIYGLVNLYKLSLIKDPNDANAKHAKAFIERFAPHPAVVAWKTLDEPQWGKFPIDAIANAYRLIKQWDPNHPQWMNQAPRGTLEEIAEYNKYADIVGVDIYPVSVPMGKHSHLPNKNISVVGDYCKWISKSVDGKKPFWMVLQISFSGAVPPKPVIFPTLEQERYMVYQAIINGARGLLFFGGRNILEGRDKELGWNWTFWQNVLKPVLLEITGPDLKPVLTAPDSKLKLNAEGAKDIEFLVREANGKLYILAAKREGPAATIRFSGLPRGITHAEVLFENRSIQVKDGAFEDRFEPNAVHIYRLVE